MGRKWEQIRMSYRDCYPIEGRVACKYRVFTAPAPDRSYLVSFWYDDNGNIDEDKTYAEWWLKENGLGKYSGCGPVKMTFGQKLLRVAAATVVNGVLEADKQKKVGALSGAKRALPKPKAVRPKTALPTGSTPAAAGAKKTLLSSNKINSIAKARPKAAASRGGILSQVKTARTAPGGVSIFGKNRPLAKKENGLLGVKKVGAPKPGGMLGAKKAAAAPKKSGGLLGGGVKKSAAAPKKSGGLLGGAKKAAAPKKSGGLLGGGAKKSGGGLLGGAKKLGGGLGKRRR